MANIIQILSGLPACGKTYFANELKENNNNVLVIDCDRFMINKQNVEDKVLQILKLNKSLMSKKNKTIILDGLFLRQEQIVSMIKAIHAKYPSFEYIIECWDSSYSARRTCFSNDGGRRGTASKNTIQNAVVDEMNVQEIIQNTGVSVTVVKHGVTAKAEYQYFVDKIEALGKKYDIQKEQFLYSKNWIVKVERPDLVQVYEEDKKPVDFIELDEILEEYVPDITYLKYKRLMRECVTTEEFDESDYYSGSVYKMRYVCDLEKLYNFINK